jgi:hypothetical protein
MTGKFRQVLKFRISNRVAGLSVKGWMPPEIFHGGYS